MTKQTIKAQIKKAGFNLSEWKVETNYKCYNITLISFGLSDNERQKMTGDQVNTKRQVDNSKIEKIAQLFDVEPQKNSITV